MKPLGTLQHIQHQIDFIPAQLLLDTLERAFHAEPKVDLLRRRPGRDVARELGDFLNLFNPGVDVGLEAVEECDVG